MAWSSRFGFIRSTEKLSMWGARDDGGVQSRSSAGRGRKASSLRTIGCRRRRDQPEYGERIKSSASAETGSRQRGPKGAVGGGVHRSAARGRLRRIAMPGSVPPPTSHVSRTAQRGHSFRAKSRTERSGLGRLPAGPVVRGHTPRHLPDAHRA